MRKTLPERYYLDHFHEFLQFFEGANRPLIDASTATFIEHFQALDSDDQCLIVRAANRKYPVVVTKTFDYAEVDAPLIRLTRLRESGWFTSMSQGDSYSLGQAMTKSDLLVLLRCNGGQASSTLPKQALIDELAGVMARQPLAVLPELDEQYWFRSYDPALNYLLFLYFGHTKGRLNQFSMRDLGVMRTRQDVSQQLARFESQDAARGAFYYARLLTAFKQLTDEEKAAFSLDTEIGVFCPIGQDYRDRLLFQMGSFWLGEDPQKALSLLQQAGSDQAQEKWLRESYKLGNKEAVQKTLEAIIDDPSSDTLLAFAEDFYARKFDRKRTSTLTDMLRDATHVVQLDDIHNQSVEHGVIGYYRRQGLAAYRAENQPWRMLFGLLFWDWLYGEWGLVSEFDRRPQVLRYNDFYARFGSEIEQHLDKYCANTDTLHRYLLKQASAHYGKVNNIFMWRQGLPDSLKILLDHTNTDNLREFLVLMCKDYASLRDGFPDILVIENDTLRFEEIKAPGDQLRRNQLITIQRLRQCGFEVGITQVQWYQDPMQPYVVVDIETTGGQAAYHRITEVGMVKLIGGEEVARWQSLINPQRHIPSRITQLTGISDDMVAGAPVFAEVAEDIEAFTKDSVFVAHNVNFDYGFIKQEFARLELEFKRPKFCTCARMRKSFPGLKSYGLGALSAHFEIALENHHRALDDALAAAELLRLIQCTDSSPQN
ncbi:exonuclease domain-containing protein [uncultured Alteromonas sp.]|jgi:DNA polymerase-3 subunit epsilon|uniref:exonuclease domain-containing protein n=1 Tax=uncultured Alteromonas sp. TaxID=179113 RepID=UPI0025F64D46|nr:exonuclease domain-containing protein [uncultured Alteromonas sp.]